MPIIRFPDGGYDAVATGHASGPHIPGLTYFPTGGYDPVGTSRAQASSYGGGGGGAPGLMSITQAGGGGAGGGGGFNLNPAPRAGNGPFGMVPGPLGLPDPAGDLARQVPGLSDLNKGVSSGILNKLNGTLSPSTLNALKNAQAQFGVSSGMPNSGLSWNSLYGNIAGASEAQQHEGIQDYNSWIPTVSGTQTVRPELQTEIANINSINAAAPDPTQAASYAKQLFDQYLASMRGGGGGNRGPGGGMSNQGSPAGGTMPRMSSSPSMVNPVPAPSGPPSFGGSSSYLPDDGFMNEFQSGWDAGAPSQQGGGSYGVLQPEFDPGYLPYSGEDYPDFALDDYLGY